MVFYLNVVAKHCCCFGEYCLCGLACGGVERWPGSTQAVIVIGRKTEDFSVERIPPSSDGNCCANFTASCRPQLGPAEATDHQTKPK